MSTIATTMSAITEDELVRITGMGTPPVTARFTPGLTVQDALTAADVEVPSGHTVVMNGRPVGLRDTVEPDTTLVVAPLICNG